MGAKGLALRILAVVPGRRRYLHKVIMLRLPLCIRPERCGKS
jgi:hypothetical protein